MKKIFTFLAVGGLFLSSFAQSPRTVLFEEFSGENCGPCAGANPYVKRFVSLHPSNFLLLKYQVPIPSAGPIYNEYKTDADARDSYYSVNFAPFAKEDGKSYQVQDPNGANNVYYYFDTLTLTNPASSANLVSPAFNVRSATPSPCGIAITHSFSSDFDSVYVTAILNTTMGFNTASAGKMKLQMALVEDVMQFATAPGSNGEKEFHHVVRKMFPSNTGTVLRDSFLVGDADTFSFGVAIPTYIREKAQIRIIGFVQDDNTKEVHQAGISALSATPYVDAMAYAFSANKINCTNGNTVDVPVSFTLKNAGTVDLTTATITVLVNGTTAQTLNWTGTITPGNNEDVTLNPVTLNSGSNTVKVTVTLPNGVTYDVDLLNEKSTTASVAGTSSPAPIVQTFQGATFPPANYFTADENGGASWFSSGALSNNTNCGALATTKSALYYFYAVSSGGGSLYLEKVNLADSNRAKLTFYRAHRQYDDGQGWVSNDQIDVEVSTDCGANWTNIWSKAGADLATTSPAVNPSTSYKGASVTWAKDSADLNAYAGQDNVWIRFKATSDYGDNAYIDEINVSKSFVNGINEIENISSAVVAPSPAKDNATLKLNINEAAVYTITVTDMMGRTLEVLNTDKLNSGNHDFAINVNNLSTGMYLVNIVNEKNSLTRKFSVTK